MVFDSHYDTYRVRSLTRIMEGAVRVGDRIMMMSSGRVFEVNTLAVFAPQMTAVDALYAGDVGCIIASMKDVRDTRVGDTITLADRPAKEPLPGYRPAKPMVYCGLYPVINEEYVILRDAWKSSSSMMQPYL